MDLCISEYSDAEFHRRVNILFTYQDPIELKRCRRRSLRARENKTLNLWGWIAFTVCFSFNQRTFRRLHFFRMVLVKVMGVCYYARVRAKTHFKNVLCWHYRTEMTSNGNTMVFLWGRPGSLCTLENISCAVSAALKAIEHCTGRNTVH